MKYYNTPVDYDGHHFGSKAECDRYIELKLMRKWEERRMNDLISRRAAIKAIDDLPNCYNGYSDTYDKACIIGVLEELPTIEPKRGRWIKDGETYALYKCSVCNDFCPAVGYADCIPEERMYKTMKYCPNCGARMERSEE